MSKKQKSFGLRMAYGGEMPSALERRLNDRLNSGTLTVRGAGMLSDIENQRRGDATQRYGVDTQAATARMNDATNRYGVDTQAGTARYGVDAQSATARMNDATQRFGIGAQADTARMNDATQRYGVDTQAGTSRYGVDAQSATARMNDATQRYGVDTQAGTSRYGVDAQSATARMNNTTNLLGMNLQADTQRYGMDSNLLSNMWRMKDGGEIQPVRLGLRNGGEIHAANGFARSGFAERASSVKWLSPRDQMDYQAKMAGVDADLALKNEQLRQTQESFVPASIVQAREDKAAGTAANDRAMQIQMLHRKQKMEDEDRKLAADDRLRRISNEGQDRDYAARSRDLALRTTQNEQFAWSQNKANAANAAMDMPGYAPVRVTRQAIPQVDPQEAQDRARLNERRNMYDTALRGHFNAGGFGAMRPPVNAAPRNFGMPRGYGLRDGGEIHAAKGGIWGAIKGAVGMGDSDEEFAAKMNKGEPESKQPDLAAAHAVRLKREGGTWGGSGGEAARPVPTSTGKSFDGVSMQTKRSLREHGVLENGGTLKTGQGGVVPGTGKGDKIPAKYEPGEFVVSNDMLAAEPELRDHLRALREQVLAAKGMTPEEADAKAIHMDSEGSGDERGANDERESKAVKKGFGIRAYSGFDYVGSEGRGDSSTTFSDTVSQAEEERKKRAAELAAEEAAKFEALTNNPDFDVPPAAKEKLQAQRVSQQAAARNAPPAPNAATPEEMSTAFDSRSIATNTATKDTPAVLQGASGENVGFGITRFNVEGKSPLFTNMTDEAGMRSNEALISRKPQSDQDRIAGDNLSNRFAQRADAEARMAQRQAELQAEYERGQVDNRAIASSERQRELLNEQRNLERKIPRQEEAAGVNARIAALEKARLGEGENFGARENALVLDQARNDATIGIHAGDNASRERIAADQRAALAPGEALKNQRAQQEIAQGDTLAKAQQAYADAVSSGDAKAIELTGRQLSALTGKNANGEWKALPGAKYTDENGIQHVTNPMMYHTGDGREKQIGGQGGGQSNAPISKAEYDKLPKGARYTAPDGRILIKG